MDPVRQYVEVRDHSPDELAQRYAPMVKRIADHLLCRMPPSVPAEDLIQCGMIKLLEAARSYDGAREAGFGLHSVWSNFQADLGNNAVLGPVWRREAGRQWLWERHGDADVAFSPGSFTQVCKLIAVPRGRRLTLHKR